PGLPRVHDRQAGKLPARPDHLLLRADRCASRGPGGRPGEHPGRGRPGPVHGPIADSLLDPAAGELRPLITGGPFRLRQAWPALALAASLSGCGGGSPSAPTPTGSIPGVAVPNEGWTHVPEGSAITYRSNPPASGPHYPVWLRYQEYSEPMARGYWVHNLEHGAIVVLYRTD